jgi:S-formylglutathione hydrolase FrmB
MTRPIFAVALSLALVLAPEVLAQTSRAASRPRRDRTPYTGGDLSGKVEFADAPSTHMGRAVRCGIYTPPGYKDPENAERRYPVVFFLHGMWEDSNRWMGSRGGAAMFEEAIKSKKIPPVILVVPDAGDTFYSDTLNGKQLYSRFVYEELVPWVDKTWRTTGSREGRVIAGISMGGFGALRFAFNRPDLFSAVFVHMPAILPENPAEVSGRSQRVMGFLNEGGVIEKLFGDPIDLDRWKAANPLTVAATAKLEPRPAIYIDCGEADSYGFDEGCRALHDVLEKRSVPHEFAIRPGGHGWAFVRSAFPHSGAFLDKHLKASKKPEDKAASRGGD